MVQAAAIAPAAATAKRISLPARLSSSGSFHAGAPIPSPLSSYDTRGGHSARRRSTAGLRRQSSHRYHTFPTPPPKTPNGAPGLSRALSSGPSDEGSAGSDASHDGDSPGGEGATPLPVKQLCLLALLSLCEQTALNSISPYLPTMVLSFDEISPDQAGLYVGLLASAFALAQLATNLLWGYMSDTIGRKPVMLAGTSLLMVCFAFFGFCRRFWQLLLVHVAMGLLNGNAAVVPTVLGEVTDRSNQSRAFTWLPIMYSIGGITGPALGGLLVGGSDRAYPFLAPNIMSAALLLASVIILGIWFDETLNSADKKSIGEAVGWFEKMFPCSCLPRKRKGRQESWSSRWPTALHDGHSEQNNDEEGEQDELDPQEDQVLLPGSNSAERDECGAKAATNKSAFRQLLNPRTLTVLLSYLVFQLSNISFNSLYPIFASAPPPTGRDLGPSTIGVSLSLAGVATIVFQAFLFQPVKARMGNLGTYQAALLGLALSMALMPWVGYCDSRPPLGWGTGKGWLYAELGFALIVKNIAAVGGLSCVLLLITNSAPSHETLGTLNGIAQTLSAAGRSVGPFLSGGLFTLSMRVHPKGELLAWGLFGGISLLGWLGTLAIRGDGLESADWVGDDDDEGAKSGDEDADAARDLER
ncbi:MFS general substrate transporter [Pleurostoma richardsiae]|uniref:MFS general substrate transporter n=1 Tax=Pleurostoma richardsiae TaxID=41990 RepID=A0AA38R9Q7_9PEZI|nr:MFS general substrate transporter [Pleurostoma richardsiae]